LHFLIATALSVYPSFVASAALNEGRRVAFVVGNSAYRTVPLLANPANDAKAVAEALKNSGFEVVTAFDLDRAAFDQEVHKFVRELSGADFSLFYYSGHGIQIGGDNRLIPVDAALKSPMDLEVETISVRTILGYMQTQTRLQAVFLDSCRNNPFPARSFFIGPDTEATPKAVGLAEQQASAGSLIAYSTQPGNVAVDGDGKFSPFTQSFLEHGFKMGVDLQTALMRVTQDVWETTDHRQRPWASITLVEPLYLARPAIVVSAVPDDIAKPAVRIEEAPADSVNLASGVVEFMQGVLDKPLPVPIGVGAVALLDPLPKYRGETGVQVELSRPPSSGVLYFDGAPLLSGSLLKAVDLPKVSYEPSLGSEKSAIHLEWMVRDVGGTSATAVKGTLAPFIVDCDREAGEPLDLQGVGRGKLPNEIDPVTAAAACERAINEYPNIARYKYQLGRAKLAAKEVSTAIALFERAAEAGHVRALYQLGYMAQRGVGRKQDLEDAERFFKQGAESGDPYAMLSHGRNLVFGRGTSPDPKAGVGFLNKAVELGHTYAMNELGSMYYYGRVVRKNPERGVRFYQAALLRDDIYAMNNLGLAYLEGQGVSKNTAKAFELFKRASEGGHPAAPGNIGRMYFNGSGLKKDIAKAVTWYETGAERGDTWAASNLGWIFANGPDRFRDIKKATHYYGLAVALDAYGSNPDAAAALKELPDHAKAEIIKNLVLKMGSDGLETASSLDSTLALLERKAWQHRNPRLDLF
jgi:TPR repeat protein